MTGGGNTNSAVPGAIVPDGGWGWIIVLSSFMIHFIMDGITYSMGDVYLQPMMEVLHKKRGYVSAIFSILPAVTLGAGPIATIFTNRYGCRQVTIVGTCIASVGFFLSTWWGNVWFYYLTIGLIGGIGFGLIYLPAIVSVGFYFERKRAFAMGIAVCGSGLGTVIFPYIMPWIINKPFWLDYDGALLLESGVILICVIFGILMIPLPQEPSEQRRLQRAEAKRLTLKVVDGVDEQKNQLLDNRESIPFQDMSVVPTTSSSAIGSQSQRLSDDKRRTSLPHLTQDDGTSANPSESTLTNNKIVYGSTGNLASQPPTTEDVPVVTVRKDSLYQGSLHNIPLYNEDTDEYHRQVIVTSKTTGQPTTVSSNEASVEASKSKAPTKSFFAEVAAQIDLNLLKDGAFALFAVSNFLTSLGFNVPYNFAKDLAIDAKVQEDHQSYIIMSIGLSNCLGRLVIGFLADRKWINRLVMYNTTLIIAGAATMAAPLCPSHVIYHMVYAAFFGFFSGGYVGLTSIIVVDLVGVDKLSDAFGVLLLFQGVAVAVGTPIVGVMRDIFEQHSRPFLWPYFIFGGFIILSGIILFAIPALRRRQERRRQPTKHQLEMGVLSYSKQNLSLPEQKQQL